MRRNAFSIVVMAAIAVFGVQVSGQDALTGQTLLQRHYREGERLAYRMSGMENGRRYEIRATGVVKRDSVDYFEEYGWSDLVRNGSPVTLAPDIVTFRQRLSLDPGQIPAIPNLARVPSLIGPITDFLTFYSDLWLAIRRGELQKAGDRFYQAGETASSWADGTTILFGETAIDFDVTLKAVDRTGQTVTLLVRHVPPKRPLLKFPALWMSARVGETENNHAGIRRNAGGFTAWVGKETFDVEMTISRVDGSILSGTLDNVVETRERDCSDPTATNCGDARSRRVERRIEIARER